MIDPSTENDSNRIRYFLNLLVELILPNHFDEPFFSIRREKLRVESHDLQQLIPLLVDHDVDVVMTSDRCYNFLFSYVI